MSKAHLTAISRKSPSVPMRNLDKKGLLIGNMLDYGCGRGFDANHFNMDGYDPHYSPDEPTGLYDTITCNYVLNVVHEDQGQEILSKINNLLKDEGKAYITVRRDIEKNLGKEGYTSKGTFQRNVVLPLPVFKETSAYCTYILTKGEI